MNKFKIIVEGKNFNILIENAVQKCGFFTTRFVEADSLDSAENTALDLIREELKGMVLNEEDDPPSLFFDQIEEIKSFGDHQVPGTGFTWYLDNQNE